MPTTIATDQLVPPDVSVQLDNAIGMRPRTHRDRLVRDLLDTASEIQDDVLDRQRRWLADLDIDDATRDMLFKRMCVVTGQLIDGLFVYDPNRAA